MPIAKSHFDPDPKKRKAKPSPQLRSHKKAEYDRVEKVIDEIVVDIVNGLPKSDCMQKMAQGMYPSQFERAMVRRADQYDYYNAAIARLQGDLEKEREKNLAIVIARFELLYKEALEANDRASAINALKEIAKMLGVSQPPTPTTAIQINNNKDGVKINFGFTPAEEISDGSENDDD